jgi:integrase
VCKIAFPPPTDFTRQQQVQGRKKEATRLETVKEWKARHGSRWAELRKWRSDHRFHPHQLRHSAATRLRKKYGLEAAQVILGHQTTEIYAEKNIEAATRVMADVG